MTNIKSKKFMFIFKSITIGIIFLSINCVFINTTIAQCTTPPDPNNYSCSGGNGVITNNANVNSGQTYWYTSTGTVSGVNMGGGTLVVCGTLTLSGGNNNGGAIIVKSGATLNISMSSLNGIIYNYGTLNINASLSMNSNALLLNASTGTINTGGNYTLTCNGLFVNYGTANIYSVSASNSSNRICMGTNSVINATNISSNTGNGWNAPSGVACVSYSGNASISNENFTSSSNIHVCRKAGSSVNGNWGSAVVTYPCTSCSSGSGLSATLTATPNTICSGNTTTLSATVSGGTSPYSYTWSDGAMSGATPTSPALTANTTYTVTVTDNASSTATSTIAITVNQKPTPSIIGTTTICNGLSTTLSSSSASSYSWSNSENRQNITVSPTTNATYTITVTNANGCTGSTQVAITILPIPTANAGSDVTITTGGSTTLTATGGNNYTWNTSANTQTITVSPAYTTTYTVTANDVNGCTASDNVVVTIQTGCKQPPNEDDFICSGGNGAIINNSNINSGQTYWYDQTGTLNNFNVSGGTAIICGNLTVNSINFNGGKLIIKSGASLTVNSYSNINCNVYNYGTVTINNGAIIHSPVEFINSNCAKLNINAGNYQLAVDGEFINYGTANLYSIKTQGSANRVCLGVNGVLNVTNIETWSSNNYYATDGGTACLHYTGTANLNNGALTSTSAINVCKGSGATKTGSGTWGSATINENCNSCISNPVSAGNDVAICTGSSTSITATGGGTYNWSNSATTASTTVSPTITTTYTVTVTTNSCTASDNVIVTVNTIPTVNAGTNQTICSGDTVNLTATGASSYIWSTSATTAGISVFPIITTTYTVTGSNGTCSDIKQIVITVYPTFSALIYPTGVVNCLKDTITLYAYGEGVTNYLWSNGSTSQVIQISVTDTVYTVTMTGSNGCQQTSSFSVASFTNSLNNKIDSSYIYINGKKDYWYVQPDIYTFNCHNDSMYTGSYDTTVIEKMVYQSGVRENIIEMHFKSNATNYQKLIEIGKIRENSQYECEYPVLTQYPDEDRTKNKWIGLTKYIAVVFRRAKTTTELQDFANKYQLQLVKTTSFGSNKKPIYTFKVGVSQCSTSFLVCKDIYQQDSAIVKIAVPTISNLAEQTTADPYYADQWFIENNSQCVGQNPSDTVSATASCHIKNVWDLGYTGAGVKIAVIDNDGFETNHPDMTGQFLTGYNVETGTSDVSPSYNGINAAHGMACAGIIAANANNNIGSVGVAYGAKIIPVKVGYLGGRSYYDAIAWAITQNPDIINLSFGWKSENPQEEIINYLLEDYKKNGRGGKGGLIVASSGNDYDSVTVQSNNIYPARNPNVLGVIASTPDDKLKTKNDKWGSSWGSNYGNIYDIAAPGTHIITTDYASSNGYNPTNNNLSTNTCTSTSINNNYSYFSGTSASTAIVSGIAALIIQKYPNITIDQLIRKIELGAKKIGGYSYDQTGKSMELGYGRIDALDALSADTANGNISPNSFLLVNPSVGNLELFYNISNINENVYIDVLNIHVVNLFHSLLNKNNTYLSLNMNLTSGIYIVNIYKDTGEILLSSKLIVL